MSDPVQIFAVRFTAALPEQVQTGLIGWASCVLNGSLKLDGFAIRRTTDGRLALSFPARRDGAGRQRFFVRPLDDATRREIEAQVFAALGLQQGHPAGPPPDSVGEPPRKSTVL